MSHHFSQGFWRSHFNYTLQFSFGLGLMVNHDVMSYTALLNYVYPSPKYAI